MGGCPNVLFCILCFCLILGGSTQVFSQDVPGSDNQKKLDSQSAQDKKEVVDDKVVDDEVVDDEVVDDKVVDDEVVDDEVVDDEVVDDEVVDDEVVDDEVVDDEVVDDEVVDDDDEIVDDDDDDDDDEVAPKPKEGKWVFGGNLALSYRFRSTSNDSDQDIWGNLGLDISYREKREDIVRIVLNGTGKVDIDDFSEPVFYSLEDTYANKNRFELYTGYVEVNLPDYFIKVRVGRQHYWELMGIHFDGGHISTELLQGRLYAEVFGGTPTRYFESPRSGNWLLGTGFKFKITPKLIAHFSYIHINDQTSGQKRINEKNSGKTHFRDDYFAVKLQYYPIKNISLWGRYTFIENQPRRGEIHAKAALPTMGTYMGASLIWQSRTIRDFSTEFSQFYPVLIETQPYIFAKLFIMSDLSDHLTGRLQGEIKRLRDTSTEGRFNHAYERIWTSLAYRELFIKELELSVSVSYWNTSDSDNIFTVDGELAYQPDPKLRFSVGSRFYLYKYRFNYDDEVARTRSIYTHAQWEVYPRTKLTGKFEVERSEVDTTYSLFISAVYSL